MVHLQALGRIDLRGSSGETLAAVASRPREMALLVYLATAGPEELRRRDTVLAMFWPETPEDRARHTLNQMLYGLRRALGDSVLISRGQDEIGVDHELIACDVVEFRRALEEARWEDALDLYQGPFLPGFFVSRAPGMERWIEEERQDHRRAARDAAVTLSERCEQRGDLDAAATWARRAWHVEPSSEGLLRRLMTLLHRTGERAEALAAFDEFRKRAEEEYGLEPTAETLELVATIRATDGSGAPDEGRQALLVSRGVAADGGDLIRPSASGTGRGLGGTLVGAGAALLGAAAVSWVILMPRGAMTPSVSVEAAAPVVVVLPVVVSGSVSPEYGDLAEALTDELTARLGEVPGLMVVPPESAEPLLRETADVTEVGRRLQGDAVVQSAIQWQPSAVETSAQVTDVRTGQIMWESSHQHPVEELLSAQQDVTLGVASALSVRIASLPDRDLAFASDEELRTWSLVQQARSQFSVGPLAPEKEQGARTLLQRALALDPEYGPAYAVLSRLYARKWNPRAGVRGHPRWADSAVVAAERAVSLDPNHVESHLALSWAMLIAAVAAPERYPPEVRRRGAEAALRAVQLSPGSWAAAFGVSQQSTYGSRKFLWERRAYFLRRDAKLRDWASIQRTRSHTLWVLGDYDGAEEALRLFFQLTPELDPNPQASRIPEYNLSRGRLEEARRQIGAVRARDPESLPGMAVAVYLELMEGRYEAAEVLLEELLNRDPPVEVIASSNLFTRTALGYVYLKTGRSREGRRLLEVIRDAELARLESGPGYTTHYNLARIFAMLGAPDQAVYWLQVAVDRGWPFHYTEMGRTDPMLESLLGDEDFELIMDDLKARLDAEREWLMEMLALPEPERFRAMLLDAEEQVEIMWGPG